MLNKYLLLFLCVLLISHKAVAEEYQSIKIYYCDWDFLSRVRMNVDDVRKVFFTKIEIVNQLEIRKFTGGFSKKGWISSNESETPDVRLVMDFYNANGDLVKTYYASKFYLYSSNGKKKIKIEDKFREKFKVRAEF
jgi:hypothetical protein